MPWSDDLRRLTRATLYSMPITPDGLIGLKHEDGRFGAISLDGLMANRFVVVDRASGAESRFADADAFIADGWVVD